MHFRGEPLAIAAGLLAGDAPALLDPGPASTLDALRAGLSAHGLSVQDIASILLTHIHLDHAGATGALVRENPRLRVYVHGRGARHIVDPTRLLNSAHQLYGDALDSLFGPVLPTPAGNIHELEGGERLPVGGRRLDVAYTPGHAKHHVSYFDAETGIAFVGDTCGLREPGSPFVLPVTPPPDVDLDGWWESLRIIENWSPASLFITHFGHAAPPGEHVAQFRERLRRWSERVHTSLHSPGDDHEHARAFADDVEDEARRALAGAAEWYVGGAELPASWHGLARYWRTRPG